MITPREMLRDYMTVLNILMQNPQAAFSDVVGSAVTLKPASADPEDAWSRQLPRRHPVGRSRPGMALIQTISASEKHMGISE